MDGPNNAVDVLDISSSHQRWCDEPLRQYLNNYRQCMKKDDHYQLKTEAKVNEEYYQQQQDATIKEEEKEEEQPHYDPDIIKTEEEYAIKIEDEHFQEADIEGE
ncbi:hypothetical protein Pmani_004506 [Petrolisthes manimaculis]|uniref:Uncharacterized protein n=1 Tax=Petrolisthes manimaculis TaxID=1843537 RepID=A0AAE1QDX5_9EUCA|nr:hypothetical protein Pmani_004506 [Petrolisthes manimaculis]